MSQAAPAGRFPTVHSSGPIYGTMSENECRQQWSIAYVQAVVTAARCKLEILRIDDEGVDAVIRQAAEHSVYDSVPIDVQLKCTSQTDLIKDDHIAWRLKRQNYDQLRAVKTYDFEILIVVTAPLNFATWLNVRKEHVVMQASGYWVNLYGWKQRASATTTVKVPRSNVFDAEQLLKMLARVGNGGRP